MDGDRLLERAEKLVGVLDIENDRLRARVEELERALSGEFVPPIEWRFTASEALAFGVLMTREIVSKKTMMTALYGLKPDQDSAVEKICDVFICKIRRKVGPFGVRIETHWGRGWALHPDDRKALAAGEALPRAQAARDERASA